MAEMIVTGLRREEEFLTGQPGLRNGNGDGIVVPIASRGINVTVADGERVGNGLSACVALHRPGAEANHWDSAVRERGGRDMS